MLNQGHLRREVSRHCPLAVYSAQSLRKLESKFLGLLLVNALVTFVLSSSCPKPSPLCVFFAVCSTVLL